MSAFILWLFALKRILLLFIAHQKFNKWKLCSTTLVKSAILKMESTMAPTFSVCMGMRYK